MHLTANATFATSGSMTKAGMFILSVTALSAIALAVPAGIRDAAEALFPLRSYVCDFRLISPATCNLPLAANTTRVSISSREADREKRLAYRDRIIACEREKTLRRINGEPVPARKCWHEGLTSFASVSSR
jgi:hypothetical protein